MCLFTYRFNFPPGNKSYRNHTARHRHPSLAKNLINICKFILSPQFRLWNVLYRPCNIHTENRHFRPATSERAPRDGVAPTFFSPSSSLFFILFFFILVNGVRSILLNISPLLSPSLSPITPPRHIHHHRTLK